MPNPLPEPQRKLVIESIRRTLAVVRPELLLEAPRPGAVAEVERHVDALVDIVRRTTAPRIEPYLFQIMEDICGTCAHQEPCGYCPLRGDRSCALNQFTRHIVDAIATTLAAIKDPAYLELHSGRLVNRWEG